MVKKIINKPHLFFFGLIPIYIIVALFSGDKAIDLNIHDTYFVIGMNHWCYFSAVFFGLIGLNYFSLFWAKKPPKKWLTITHLFLQILSLMLFFTIHNWNWIGKQYPAEFNVLNDNSNSVLFISFLVFIFSVFIHLVNFFTSLFLKTE